jgi:hypothetical protein
MIRATSWIWAAGIPRARIPCASSLAFLSVYCFFHSSHVSACSALPWASLTRQTATGRKPAPSATFEPREEPTNPKEPKKKKKKKKKKVLGGWLPKTALG